MYTTNGIGLALSVVDFHELFLPNGANQRLILWPLLTIFVETKAWYFMSTIWFTWKIKPYLSMLYVVYYVIVIPWLVRLYMEIIHEL